MPHARLPEPRPDLHSRSTLQPTSRGVAAGLAVLAALAVAGSGGCGRATSPLPITIVATSQPLGAIERAAEAESLVNWRDADRADDRACTESFAAVELRRFMALALRTPEDSIRLSSALELPASGTVILLTSGPDSRLGAADTAHAPALGASEEAFRIFTVGGRRLHVVQGRSRIGTLYGAYAFLDRMGVRFYAPGESGTVLPASAPEPPAKLEVAEQPGYATRGFWAWEPRGNRDFFLWMARNRMNLWTAEDRPVALLHKLGIRLTAGGHQVQKTLLDPDAEYPYARSAAAAAAARPADPYRPSSESRGDRNHDGRLTYFEAHPEWFGLQGGARSANLQFDAGDNYCTSNADATRELTKNLIASLESGAWREADVVMLWALDRGRWCTCASCQALGTPSDRLFTVIDTVSAALSAARARGTLNRSITLGYPGFEETMAPPLRSHAAAESGATVVHWFPIDRCYVHALADSHCVQINRSQLREYEAWTSGDGRSWNGPIGVGEYYNISSFRSLPVVMPHVIAADLKWYYDHGARHFHYMHVPTAHWGPIALNHALIARLTWNPHANGDSIASEYFRVRYPTQDSLMRSFYANVETATANLKLLKHRVRKDQETYQLVKQLEAGAYPFALGHLHYEHFEPPVNDGPDWVDIMNAVRTGRQTIDDAIALAPAGDERQRIVEDDRRFRYLEATLVFYDHLLRYYLADHHGQTSITREEWPQLAAAAERLRGMKDVSLDAGAHANAKDGLEATELVDFYRGLEREHRGDR